MRSKWIMLSLGKKRGDREVVKRRGTGGKKRVSRTNIFFFLLIFIFFSFSLFLFFLAPSGYLPEVLACTFQLPHNFWSGSITIFAIHKSG